MIKTKEIAIEIVKAASSHFATTDVPWDDTVYCYDLTGESLGYSVVIWGEGNPGNNACFSINIRKTDKLDEPGSEVPTRYTADSNVISLRDGIKNALDAFVRKTHPETKNNTKRKNKYRKGGHILTLDELARQDFVYWYDKVVHHGWFKSWQLRFAECHIGENGCIYYAIKEEDDA